MRWPKYDRNAPHAYTLGVFPTLELLQHRPAQVREVLLHSRGERNSGATKLMTLCAAHGIPVRADDRAVERLGERENTYAVGVFEKYSDALPDSADHLVLVNPSDMGNLGTIMRTLLGLGGRALALIRPAADCFDPRVIRASMGALFQLEIAYFADFEAYRAQFPGQALYPFMTDGAARLGQITFQRPCAWVFGNESSGLPTHYQASGTSVTIPQSAGIDSLNLAVAVGIALYEANRERLSGGGSPGSTPARPSGPGAPRHHRGADTGDAR